MTLTDATNAPNAPMEKPEITAQNAMQLVVTALTLAALPIAGWMYVATYVEDSIKESHDSLNTALQRQINTQAEQISDLSYIITQLCRESSDGGDFRCASRPRFPSHYFR